MTALFDLKHADRTEILIVARNAETTVAEALRSIQETSPVSILLVDNGSTDNTAERASEAAASAGLPIKIVSLTDAVPVGRARGMALQNARAEYGIWLDADDRFRPGRVATLISVLYDTNTDYAFDGCLIAPSDKADDAESLGQRRAIPRFLMSAGYESHLYERNWLPALTGAFRISTARDVGYDAELTSAEDYDHLLRGMLAGARLSFADYIGYIYCDHPGTLSRDLERSRKNSRSVLLKLPVPRVMEDMQRRGLSAGDRDLIIAGIHAQAGRWTDLLRLCRTTARKPGWSDIWQWDNELRWRFHEANALLRLENTADAMQLYRSLVVDSDRADIFNNLGVCHAQSGNREDAQIAWRRALTLKPNYADALNNLRTPDARELTVLPLRPAPIRDDYA